jgi:hypothetical protein
MNAVRWMPPASTSCSIGMLAVLGEVLRPRVVPVLIGR